jgi:hypothetical protein
MSCQNQLNKPKTQTTTKVDTLIYTPYSSLPNTYHGFHSPNAINALAKMENAYFRNYGLNGTGYYGTVWRSYAEGAVPLEGGPSLYARFVDSAAVHGCHPDSMHCTIYAVAALEAGLGPRWDTLEAAHRKIWKAREHAGWSLGYLLVRDFGWKAWLVIRRDSPEFTTCERAWKASKTYPVWKQPDIALSGFVIKGEQDSVIQTLLLENEFGWGFSHQGIHTWVTRFDTLKECNWYGAPARQFEHPGLIQQDQLFTQTRFLDFERFASHVVIFPPKE